MPAPKPYTKGQILDAMDKTKSVRAAARYLNCSYWHLKDWMKKYTDDATGKTLFELHKNPSGKGMVKSELNEDGLEIVGSNTEVVGDVSHASASGAVAGSIGSIGYDNTLKDISPGRYGKIVVRKSGRTELVIGGQDGEPEVWK